MAKLWVFAAAGRRISTERGEQDRVVGVELTGVRQPTDDELAVDTIIVNTVVAAQLIYGLYFMFSEAGREEELKSLIDAMTVDDRRKGKP